MAKIIISYRRADSEAITGRIRDRLVSHYGTESIFMDIDSIPFGIDFRDYIKDALNETDVLIAVIGSRWTGAMDAGPARIMEETDPVRIEVETALARGIAVIPLLLDEATMPQPAELPDSLKNLSFRNAAHVDSGRDFHLHMDRLIRSMDKLLGRMQAGCDGGAAGGALTAAPVPQYSATPFAAAQQSAAASAPQITAMAPPKKRGWVKWVAIAAAIPIMLLGVLAIIGLLVRSPTKTAQAPTSPPSMPAAPAPAPAPTPSPAAPAPAQAPAAPNPVVSPPAEPTPASAPPPSCTGGTNVAFQDNFATPAAGWDDASASRYFADGQMVFRFEKPGLLTWLYRPLRFKNASVCASVRAPLQANKLDGVASGGIVFWATDYSNYYLAQLYLDGTFQIYRRLSNEWIPVVTRTKSPHIRAGLGAVNELQVTTKDASGTVFVNGQKLVDFRGQPPSDGGSVGLHGESEADRGGEWRFMGITVVDDEAPKPVPVSAKATRAATNPITCKGDKDAAFADDFKRPDAGWGDMTATAFYQDGMMVLKPMQNRTRTLLYRSLRYVNATLCANTRWPTNPIEAGEITSGGVAFWGTDYSNFYEASLYRDGSYDVYRLLNDTWYAIRRRSKSDVIKTAPDAVNQLKVQLVNNKATLYINDVKIIEFWGQPPPRGGAIGLFAQSDKQRQNEWRFTDIVVVD